MNWNILGHPTAVRFLKEQTQPDKLRHAYLITGPEGVGRETLSLAFIMALNCIKPPETGEFCGECLACRQIKAQSYADLTVLRPPEGTRELKIDQIRAMQQTLSLAPYQSKYRTVLIPDFQNATQGASNALLKSLEEPPSRAVLILTADARESLLETISSRCEVVRLRPQSVAEAQAGLMQQFGLDEERARLLAHLSGGRIGAALAFENDPEKMGAYYACLDQLQELLFTNLRGRINFVERLQRQKGSSREQFYLMISTWLTFWRDVLIRKTSADLPLVNLDKEELINKISSQVESWQIESFLKIHENALRLLGSYVNPRLILENLLLNLPRFAG